MAEDEDRTHSLPCNTYEAVTGGTVVVVVDVVEVVDIVEVVDPIVVVLWTEVVDVGIVVVVAVTDVVAGLLEGAADGVTGEVSGDAPPQVSTCAPGVQFSACAVIGPE